MKVRIKKLTDSAIIPSYAKPGDAGMDLTAIAVEVDEYRNRVYKTGIAVEIPAGYVGLIFPRSSNAKTNLYLTNHVGVIDSAYRGELIFKYKCIDVDGKNVYQIGDRIGQLIIIPYPQIEFEEVSELSSTDRGIGGFGSTGN
jgi:dUTP pyrophosphatase